MSEHFIEYLFPCKDCIIRATCSPNRIPEEIQRNGLSLAVPEFEKGKTYHKGLIECWSNIGKKVLDKTSKNSTDGTQEPDHIPIEYVRLISYMASIICHIINSTSWSDGKLYAFDKDEISRRLKFLQKMI
jgi:hypothetical protein